MAAVGVKMWEGTEKCRRIIIVGIDYRTKILRGSCWASKLLMLKGPILHILSTQLM